ncbi:FtsX-like permease family protein [Labilibaculum sp. A4]|uniref:ABC transporter permease n=1 Tax=Labilibaculum euxinus TaxID=2686357 RepID=UPI000F61E762|nr:FtsX-like permease family protein [Labilibaculum euxinus]MDQ1769979.1 ABC transporter permease [Labilibaculum euxinus]MWN77401.1 FtsX-like permease family protein [Labilibaculum euxinus]
MLWYHLKLSVLRLLKNRAFSVTNILGLSFGIASFFVLFIHVQNERSYDRHIKDYQDIYRVASTPSHVEDPWARSLGFIKETSTDFPEVEDATQFSHCQSGTIKIHEQNVSQEDILSVDTNFMNLFGIESLIGNLSDITKPNVAFISERFAEKHFKDRNPIGEYIDVEGLQYRRDLGKYEIVGIVKNTPIKTHFNCEILLSQKGSLDAAYASLSERKTQWVYNYLKLKKGVSPSLVEEKLLNAFNNSSLRQTRGPKDYEFSLTKLSDIHLKSNFRFELKESNTKININLFTSVAVIILMVSLINFVSLITVNLFKRSKEFGLKTSVGAHKKHLLTQVLIEVILLCSLSIIIALILIEALTPYINNFYEVQFDIFYSEPIIYLAILTVLIFSGILSILFVRFFILKNNSTSDIIKGHTSLTGRRILQPLMIFQILIVIVLISSAILVNKQISYLLNKPLGFTKDNVVVLNIKDFSKDPNVFANELRKKSSIESIGFTMQHFGYPTQTLSLDGFGIEGTAEMSMANYDFLKTMNIPFVHNYINTSLDTIEGMVINKHLFKRLMEKHKTLEELNLFRSGIPLEADQRRVDIIGVVEDFNYSSAHNQIGDYVFLIDESQNRARFMHVRMSPGNIRSAMTSIQEEWQKHYPNQKMDYFFIDDKIAQQYKSENILRRILMSFSVLGIIISILGISALSYFTSEQRTKEIGVRKVNGAKTFEVIAMLNKGFAKWVVIAFVIACPIAWYAMHKWLENFAYKTELSWWIFALAGLIALGIALLTVSFQSWRAATRNPVESLRYE